MKLLSMIGSARAMMAMGAAVLALVIAGTGCGRSKGQASASVGTTESVVYHQEAPAAAPATVSSSGTIHITDASFGELSSGVALVDFTARWCGPCQRMGPVIDSLASDMRGQVKVAKMDVDNSPQTPNRFGVSGIPTCILLRDGQEVARCSGVYTKEEMKEWMKQSLGSDLTKQSDSSK